MRLRTGGRPQPSQSPLPPRPDHGVVEVEPWTEEAAAFWHDSWEDETGRFWRASWRDGHRLLQSPPGSRDAAVAWAYRVPAAWRLMRNASTAEWTGLPGR
jgi:hypothetical protein